ncbi:hypothetical protein LJB92_00700 [Bacteroidales bacterium OttesenSCG-928-M06]|nr:hypothetical protein [Bacteroidales bacterium OttesenSCG-928-M06]
MKTINKLGYLFIALLCIVSCSDDTYKPGAHPSVRGQGVFFGSEDNFVTVELEPDSPTEFEIELTRMDTENTVSVGVKVVNNEENVFSLPETVTFEAGNEKAYIPVSFPEAEIGVAYRLEVELTGDNVNVYSEQKTQIAYEVSRIKWDAIDGGIYMDGMIVSFYGVPYPDGCSSYVEAQIATFPTGDQRIRIINPYKAATDDPDENGIADGYLYNGEEDVINNNVKMLIDISGNTATMKPGALGFDWGEGEFIAGSVNPYLPNNFEEYPAREDYPKGEVVYADEEETVISYIVFPSESLYLIEGPYATIVAENTYFFFSLEAYKEVMLSDVE